MDIESKDTHSIDHSNLIQILVIIFGLFVYYLFEWEGLILYFGIVLLFLIIEYNIDLFYLAYILMIGVTAQLNIGYQNYLSYGFSLLLILIWLIIKLYSNTKLEYMNKNLFYLVLFYLFWNIFCSFFSLYFYDSLFASIRAIIFFLIIYIIFDWIDNEKKLKNIINVIILIGLIGSLFSVFDFIKTGTLISNGEVVRFSGVFSGVNAFGYVLSFSIPFILYKLIIKDSNKILLYLMLIFTLFALFLTFSRSAWLSVFISSSIILLRFNRIRNISFVIGGIITGLFLFSQEFTELFNTLIRVQRITSYREYLWEAAFKIISDFPLVGIGPGMIEHYIVQYTGLNPKSWLGGLMYFARHDAHNLYLTTGAELGILGIVIALSVFIVYYIIYFETKKSVVNTQYKFLLITCGAIVLGVFFRSFFEGNGVITKGYLSFDIYFWLIFIITIKLRKKIIKN